MGSGELEQLVRQGGLDELQVLQVLRNPYCSGELAQTLAGSRSLLTSHKVRELLARFRGLNVATAMNLLATLPWLSLLEVAKAAKTPPLIRRNAEARLLGKVMEMTLGERTALARKAHRPLFKRLIGSGDAQVIIALLSNQYLVENDILLMLNTMSLPQEVVVEIARHQRWGRYHRVKLALVVCKQAPLPVALSALVELTSRELSNICTRPDVLEPVKQAAQQLREKRQQTR